MAAIVDAYTSMTADASAGRGAAPAQALRDMYQMGDAHFNLPLLQEFIRMVGLYPVGTLIMLESRRLAVVVEPHETSLLTPKVIVFFDTNTDSFLKPATLDLARPNGHGGADRILGPESPAKWKVAPLSIAALA